MAHGESLPLGINPEPCREAFELSAKVVTETHFSATLRTMAASGLVEKSHQTEKIVVA